MLCAVAAALPKCYDSAVVAVALAYYNIPFKVPLQRTLTQVIEQLLQCV